MYKAVIFDLNGVLIASPLLSERFERDFGVSSAEFLPALKDVMLKVRLPNADSLFACFQPHFSRWGLSLSETQLHDYWFGAEREVPEMIDLAKELRSAGIKVIVLSNNFRERSEYYDGQFGFLKAVTDATYYSWQTGFVKPDERGYRLVMRENDLQPEECVYFDDSETNTEVATGLGIKSFLFRSAEDAKKQLKGLGVGF